MLALSQARWIRYELIDGAGGDQGGHTLEGFIEFDMACGGNCTSENIVDFTFTVTGPSNYSYSYQVPEDAFLSQGDDQEFIDAGLLELTIDYNRWGVLILRNSSEEGSPLITWDSASFSNPIYGSAGPDLSGGWVYVHPTFTPGIAVIGYVVPEPASWVYFGITLILVLRSRYIFVNFSNGKIHQ